MDDTTSLLLGLGNFRVVDVVPVADRLVQVVVETVDGQGICPECGQPSTRVKDRALVRIRDLPAADRQVALWWRNDGCRAWSRRVGAVGSPRPRCRSRPGPG